MKLKNIIKENLVCGSGEEAKSLWFPNGKITMYQLTPTKKVYNITAYFNPPNYKKIIIG